MVNYDLSAGWCTSKQITPDQENEIVALIKWLGRDRYHDARRDLNLIPLDVPLLWLNRRQARRLIEAMRAEADKSRIQDLWD